MIKISEKQACYIRESTHRYNIKMGATQSGKTYLDTLYLIPKRIMERKGKSGLCFIVGVSKETIERNVLSKLREIWGDRQVTSIGSRNTAKLFGETVYCIGAENKGQVKKFRGATAKYIYIDEFPDIEQEVFDIFPSRLSLDYSCVDMTGNPKTPSHWSEDFLKSDRDIYFQRYTLYDNPFLSERTITEIERDYKGTVYFDRYVLGLPKAAEGLVFPMMNEPERFVSDKIDLSDIDFIETGMDIGGTTSSHSLVTTAQDYDGKLYVLLAEEMKATGTDTSDIENFVKSHLNKLKLAYKIQPERINADHIPAIINSINANIHPCYATYKCAREDRPFVISRLLMSDRLLFAKDMCEPLIKQMQGVVFSKDGITMEDDNVFLIDVIDAFVYSCSKSWSRLLD